MTVAPAPSGPTEMTFAEFVALEREIGWRYEVLDGVLVVTRGPVAGHQRVVRRALILLDRFVREHQLGEVFAAPMPLELGPRTYVEPDVFLVARGGAVQEGEDGLLHGAPALVVEVLSPSTRAYDRGEKYRLYAQSGVKEYWLIDPESETLEAFRRSGDLFSLIGLYRVDEAFSSEALPGMTFRVSALFAD